MPSHSLGVPRLADRIAAALYARIGDRRGRPARYDVQPMATWPRHAYRTPPIVSAGHVEFSPPCQPDAPLLNLPSEELLSELTADYVHAQLCNAALHAFAAENEARMEAMAAARHQIERQLSTLQATERLVRQEEITAEIIELAAGETASQAGSR